jgi:hypothetical protein
VVAPPPLALGIAAAVAASGFAIGDANTILANPLQIAVITLGLIGFCILYAGYLAVSALDESERQEIEKGVTGLTGMKREMRFFALLNPKVGTHMLDRWRRRPAARRRVYLGAVLLAAAIAAWRFVN